VASLMGLRHRVEHEGEAAMALEFAAGEACLGGYGFPLVAVAAEPPLVVDWVPALAELLGDMEAGMPASTMASRFHAGLVAAVVAVAERVGAERVALTGGCFQNRLLTDRAAAALRREGFRPLVHRQVPANDGGLALGQVTVAAAVLRPQGGR
jgi:hydrogenase maturation protein HypF